MSIQNELSHPNPIGNTPRETAMSVIFTAEMLRKECDLLLRPLGQSESQFHILSILLRNDAPGLPQVALSRMLLVHRSNVTGLLERMEKRKWISRVADPEDGRIKLVALTPAGRKLALTADEAYQSCIEHIMTYLPSEELNRLNSLLKQLRRNLNE